MTLWVYYDEPLYDTRTGQVCGSLVRLHSVFYDDMGKDALAAQQFIEYRHGFPAWIEPRKVGVKYGY